MSQHHIIRRISSNKLSVLRSQKCPYQQPQQRQQQQRLLLSNSATTNKKKNDNDDVAYVIPKSFVVGSLAGVCGSLAGMGGGFVMIPIMTSGFLKLSQHQAHGTSLFAVAATGVAGAVGYQGQAQFDSAAAIAVCGIVTSAWGASLTAKISEQTLKKALGVFMILVAPMVPLKGYLQQQQQEEVEMSKKEERNEKAVEQNLQKETITTKATSSITKEVQHLLPPAMIGLGSGVLAGLFGVGGGAVVVPALTLFTDLNHYQALGTSLCAMVFPAISGTVQHFRTGNVAMRVAPALAAGAFCGGYLGGKFGMHVQEETLRWGFSGLMIVLGTRTFLKA